jgi:lysophospholipase L1-like esterase
MRAATNRMVYFGDSITGGEGASDNAHKWTTIVTNARGYTSAIVEGIDGTPLQNTNQNTVDTIGGAVDDNGRDTYTSRVCAHLAKYAVILYGLNDLRLDDAAFSSANFQTDLGELVDGLTASGIPADNIVIGSPPYVPEASYALYDPWDAGSRVKHAAYSAACAAVAATKHTRYADVYGYMTNQGGDSLIGVDGIHPNDSGHAAIAAALLLAL